MVVEGFWSPVIARDSNLRKSHALRCFNTWQIICTWGQGPLHLNVLTTAQSALDISLFVWHWSKLQGNAQEQENILLPVGWSVSPWGASPPEGSWFQPTTHWRGRHSLMNSIWNPRIKVLWNVFQNICPWVRTDKYWPQVNLRTKDLFKRQFLLKQCNGQLAFTGT